MMMICGIASLATSKSSLPIPARGRDHARISSCPSILS
jgi:hypothetical protein